ncbi:MAG: ZIP family metal transporter [Chitinophagaceae bacterium]|nr:ZIP family metal transporter [Chitinophagaceae bacterium]
METIEKFFSEIGPVYAALLATTFTWALTALGAAFVFFFKTLNRGVLDPMLGFTGGVMVAASFWSLLNPAIEISEKMYPGMSWMPAAVGFFLGAMFIYVLDRFTPHLHINFGIQETEGVKTKLHRTTLLILAITLHNIPEGLAVGVLFGAAALGMEDASVSAAIALAIGIGIQNFPEGIAVSMPLRRHGVSRFKKFLVWAVICDCRADCRCIGCRCSDLYAAHSPLCPGLCCWCYDFCSGGRSNS